MPAYVILTGFMCVNKIKTMYEGSRVASVRFSFMYVALVMRVQVLGNLKRIKAWVQIGFDLLVYFRKIAL